MTWTSGTVVRKIDAGPATRRARSFSVPIAASMPARDPLRDLELLVRSRDAPIFVATTADRLDALRAWARDTTVPADGGST